MGQDFSFAQREIHLGKKGGFTMKYSIKMGFMTGGVFFRREHPLYSEAVGFRTFAGQKRDSLKSLNISRFSGLSRRSVQALLQGQK
ncbi:MAG: hypothetical protein U0I22_07865 [Treponema sp.]|nr:hypothetical protein [Treponema sp.]